MAGEHDEVAASRADGLGVRDDAGEAQGGSLYIGEVFGGSGETPSCVE